MTLAAAAAALLGVARTASDLAPYLIVMGLGFLVGMWGQASRSRWAVLAGILLILVAVIRFVIDNSSGGSGIPGIPGE